MKVEYTNGCICDSIEIDGEDFRNLSAWKLGAVKDKAVSFLNATELSEVNLQDLLLWITQRYGDCEYVGHCEECGDTIYKETIEL